MPETLAEQRALGKALVGISLSLSFGKYLGQFWLKPDDKDSLNAIADVFTVKLSYLSP